MKQILLFAISLFLFSPFCFTQQTVWPGDVNNNGIVNEIDLLYLGYAFEAEGSERSTVSAAWAGQEINTPWDDTFPNGLNFAFADCNGDGIVNLDDADVIAANLKLTHDPLIPDDFLDATPDVDPQFYFSEEVITGTPGIPQKVLISLGEDTMPLQDILGLSFTIKLDTNHFQVSNSIFEFDDVSWFTDFDDESTSIISTDSVQGTIKVAITKIDKKPVSGAGSIGSVSFVIIDDIIDFLAPIDTVTLQIDSVTVVKSDLTKVPVSGTTLIVDIEGRITSTYDPILDKIKFYPNPNNGWVILKTDEVPIEKVELINTLGQRIYQKSLTKSNFHSLDLNHIPEGAYWLRMITKYGIKTTPIQKYN